MRISQPYWTIFINGLRLVFYIWQFLLFWFKNSHEIVKVDASKAKAEKLVKDAIKIVVKSGVLFHNKQIPAGELKQWEILRSKINNMANTIVYFHRTPFTYNKDMLSSQLDSTQTLLTNALKVSFKINASIFT